MNQGGFGRSMGPGAGGFWNMGGMGRGRGGPQNMGMSGRFQQSFNNRLQSSGGQSNPFGGRNSQLQMQAQNDQTVQEMLFMMSTMINQTCHNFGTSNQPESFFMDFDTYAGRHFEDWELQIIFQF